MSENKKPSGLKFSPWWISGGVILIFVILNILGGSSLQDPSVISTSKLDALIDSGQIEKIVTENRELLEGIYVYDTYKMRISELTKLSSILLKNVELTVDLNNDVYTDVKKFYYDCFLKMIVKIVKEKLTQKKRLYNDYMNKLTGIDVEIIKNRNTAVCRINREITDTVVSVTSLITEKRIFKENDRTENIPNVKLEKFIKKTDDVDSKKENKFYNISNFFGNNINVMLGDRILPDEFKPLRSLQIETVLNKVVNYKNLFSQENVYRMVTEYISSDGCEISSPVNAVNILKYYHPVNFFKDIFFGDIVCLEFAYLIEENYLILEPVFLEETAADLRICIAGDSNNIKFMNLVTNTSGIEISKLTKIIKECKTILKNYLRTVVSNMNKNKNNLCYSIRF